jgi:ABC-2 type transport system ATP-binding protein
MKLLPPAHLGRMMGGISIVTFISVPPAIGSTIRGAILSVLDWRWMFVLVLPVALTALIVGGTLMKNVTTRIRPRSTCSRCSRPRGVLHPPHAPAAPRTPGVASVWNEFGGFSEMSSSPLAPPHRPDPRERSAAAPRHDAEPLVQIRNFRMDFGRTTVIRDLSFDINRGETFGFLGSNGSGKTTTIRALLGIYQATAGVLHINGRPFAPEDGATLGYLPEERGLYKKETVIDVMTYFGRLKGLSRAAAAHWSHGYLERVALGDKARVRLDKLSGGQQQKVQLGVTIMNAPELLILDEPTKGFDPVNRKLLMDIIEEQKRAGATVLMVTHQMEEVERLCDRVVLLKNGEAEAYGTVEAVQDQYGGTVVRLQYSGEIPASRHYAVTRRESTYAELTVTGPVDEAVILRELMDAGVTVRGFAAGRPSLDDIFVAVYGDQNVGDAPDAEAVGE